MNQGFGKIIVATHHQTRNVLGIAAPTSWISAKSHELAPHLAA